MLLLSRVARHLADEDLYLVLVGAVRRDHRLRIYMRWRMLPIAIHIVIDSRHDARAHACPVVRGATSCCIVADIISLTRLSQRVDKMTAILLDHVVALEAMQFDVRWQVVLRLLLKIRQVASVWVRKELPLVHVEIVEIAMILFFLGSHLGNAHFSSEWIRNGVLEGRECLVHRSVRYVSAASRAIARSLVYNGIIVGFKLGLLCSAPLLALLQLVRNLNSIDSVLSRLRRLLILVRVCYYY